MTAEGRCGLLMYYLEDRRIDLTDDPFVIQDKHRLSSEKLTVFVDTGKIIGEGNVQLNLGVE